MPPLSELTLPALDPADPELRGKRWHGAMHELRAKGAWLAQAPLGVVVLDRAAAEQVLRTSAIFPGLLLADIFGITEGPLHEQMTRNIINVSGRDHARLRGLINPALTPSAVERHRPAMRTLLQELWSRIALDEPVDFVTALAKPYASRMITQVIGAPDGDAELLHRWSTQIQRQFDPVALADPEQRALIDSEVAAFYAWVRPLIAERRQHPAQDLISELIAAEEQDERLSDTELENLVLNLMVGGIDTTQSQLTHAVRLLAEHPEQWAALRGDPSLAADAVSEALRYEPITPFTARLTVEETEIRGVTFPAGTVIMVCAFSANRDQPALEAPDQFRIRPPGSGARLLTFGAGIHYCVGANLARAEMTEALSFLAERVSRLEPAGEPVLQSVSGIYGLDTLPLRLIR